MGNAFGLFCSFLAVILFSKPQVAFFTSKMICSLLYYISFRAALLLSLLGLLGNTSLGSCGMDPSAFLLVRRSLLYVSLFVFIHLGELDIQMRFRSDMCLFLLRNSIRGVIVFSSGWYVAGKPVLILLEREVECYEKYPSGEARYQHLRWRVWRCCF